MSRRAPTVLLVLLLAAGCDAPKVIPRTVPKSDDVIDTGPAPQVPQGDAALLKQVDAMKSRLKARHKPVGILLALGNLYYGNDRYPDAIDTYRQAIARAQPALAARKALLAKRVRPAKTVPAACNSDDPGAFETGTAKAAALAKAGSRGKALACYDALLQPIAIAYARRGAAWSMIDQPTSARKDLEHALALQPDRPEILYLLGAVIFQGLGDNPPKALVREGQHAWQRFLQVAPNDSHAAQVKQALVQVKQMLAPKPAASAPAAGNAPAAGGAAPAGAPPMAGGAPPLGANGRPMGGGNGAMPPVLAMAEEQLSAGNAAAALRICNQFLQVATGYPAGLVIKAQALMALGRGTEAGPLLAQAMEKDQSGRALAAMAEYQATVNKDVAKAKADYRKAIAKDPAYAKQAGLAKKLKALE